MEKAGLLAQHNSFGSFHISFKTSFCLFFKKQEKKILASRRYFRRKISLRIIVLKNWASLVLERWRKLLRAFSDSLKDFII